MPSKRSRSKAPAGGLGTSTSKRSRLANEGQTLAAVDEVPSWRGEPRRSNGPKPDHTSRIDRNEDDEVPENADNARNSEDENLENADDAQNSDVENLENAGDAEHSDVEVPENAEYVQNGTSAADKAAYRPLNRDMPFSSRLDLDIVTILVGEAEVPFKVHKRKLCRKVPYFKHLIGEGDSLRLADTKPEIFDLLVEWVYTNKIRMLKSTKEAGSPPATVHRTWDYYAFYIYAWKLKLGELMDRIMDMIRYVVSEQGILYGAAKIRKLFHEIAVNGDGWDATCPLQDFIVDLTVYVMRTSDETSIRAFDKMSTADLLDLMQNKSFAERFIECNRWDRLTDPRIDLPDCYYHTCGKDHRCKARDHKPRIIIHNERGTYKN